MHGVSLARDGAAHPDRDQLRRVLRAIKAGRRPRPILLPMTTRNFEALFAPRRIALIGASDRTGSVGDVLAANLLGGGFPGELMFVNPKARPVHGRPVFASVAALPDAPDLAVIATPAATVPGLVAELGARGCRAAVVISAGFEADDRFPTITPCFRVLVRRPRGPSTVIPIRHAA